MWIIPITYKLKYDTEKFDKDELMNLIESYLNELNFDYINRKENSITYHKGGIFHSLKFRDLLGSGSIKMTTKKNQTIITLKHSMVFLTLFFFTAVYLLMTSRFSTFDNADKKLFTFFFIWLFGANYLTKLISHYRLKIRLDELISKYWHHITANRI